MNTPFTFEIEPFDYAGGVGRQATEFQDQEMWEIGPPDTFEIEGETSVLPPPPPVLSGVALARAVAANRIFARRLGWGCVVEGRVQRPIPELLALLRLAAGATEEDIARAIAREQAALRLPANGQLGQQLWNQILARAPAVIPKPRFHQWHRDVLFHGRKLGVLEKTSPYLPYNDRTNGGALIELGFRVTDMDAVRRAGFVDGAEDNFRWIQRIITNRQYVNGGVIRRNGRYVDPQSGLRDEHPYYWDNEGEGDPDYRITNYRNRPSARPNALRVCYDLIFQDEAKRPLAEANPGRRVYWNAEVALVGVRPARPGSKVIRNVILNTVLWGFDLVIESGVSGVRLNRLEEGQRGGSAAFRQVLSEAIRARSFANHCFVGGGFSRAATCA